MRCFCLVAYCYCVSVFGGDFVSLPFMALLFVVCNHIIFFSFMFDCLNNEICALFILFFFQYEIERSLSFTRIYSYHLPVSIDIWLFWSANTL